jgi:hypothetical protein
VAESGATKLTPVEVTSDQAPVYPAVLEKLLTSGLATRSWPPIPSR